jgi:superfamily I DNA/RNA helicase
MELSEYQKKIIEAVETTEDNLIINGVAGCGKTTTLQLIARQLEGNCSMLYLAFSKEMVTAISPELELWGVDVKTFHSYGNQAVKAVHPGIKLENFKYFHLLDEVDYKENHFGITKSQAVNIMSVIRSSYISVNAQSVEQAFVLLDITPGDKFYSDGLMNDFVCTLREVVSKGTRQFNNMDFTDMIVMPLINQWGFKKYDLILVDECQDLSGDKIQLLRVAMRSGTRIISVGDPKQAIMGFTGADDLSFQIVKEKTNAVELPLSLCYRCPDEVLKKARPYVDFIEGTGKTGIVDNINCEEFLDEVKIGDLMICRYNAPLVSAALKLVAKKIPCRIKGNDFAKGLLGMISDVQKDTKDEGDFLTNFEAMILNKIKLSRSESVIKNLQDKLECIEFLWAESESIQELITMINNLFSDAADKSQVVTFSSFHRSKGLQNPRVFILVKPGSKFKSPRCGQESNLSYVAITRAQEHLTFVC